MRVEFFAGIIALSVVACPAWAQSAPAALDFATKASVGNTFEVAESRLALKLAKSAKIKAFARKMIKDHRMAEKKLQIASRGSGVGVTMSLDDPHKVLVSALRGKRGVDFDKAYIADQLQAHQDTTSLLTDYKTSGDNAKLKAWAAKTLPTVSMHLTMVQAMAST